MNGELLWQRCFGPQKASSSSLASYGKKQVAVVEIVWRPWHSPRTSGKERGKWDMMLWMIHMDVVVGSSIYIMCA